jgi:hypothetical protein
MLSHRLPNDVTIDQQWDQQRIGNGDKHKPLDIMNHPCKAEATIWLVEEVHRRASTSITSIYNGTETSLMVFINYFFSSVQLSLALIAMFSIFSQPLFMIPNNVLAD